MHGHGRAGHGAGRVQWRGDLPVVAGRVDQLVVPCAVHGRLVSGARTVAEDGLVADEVVRVRGGRDLPQPVAGVIAGWRGVGLEVTQQVEHGGGERDLEGLLATSVDQEPVDHVVAGGLARGDVVVQAVGRLGLAGGDHPAGGERPERIDAVGSPRPHGSRDLGEDVGRVGVAGVVDGLVPDRVPDLRRQRGAAEARGLGTDVDEGVALAEQHLPRLEDVHGVLELRGHVDPVEQDGAVEPVLRARPEDHDPGGVRRRGAVLGPRGPGDEVLPLLVAEGLELVPGVPQRVAVDPLGWLAQLRDRDRGALTVGRLRDGGPGGSAQERGQHQGEHQAGGRGELHEK